MARRPSSRQAEAAAGVPVARRPSCRQSDLTKALKAIAAAGGAVASIDILPDGSMRVVTGSPAPAEASPLDEWRAKRNARPAEGS